MNLYTKKSVKSEGLAFDPKLDLIKDLKRNSEILSLKNMTATGQ